MCILELSKMLMYKFDNNLRLFTDTGSLMYENKTEDVCKDFSNNKEMFDFSSCSTKSTYDNLNKLVVDKIKDERAGVTN